MWARYADTKTRRKKTFEQYRAEENGENGGVDENGEKKKKESRYIEFLKDKSQQGRQIRGKIDQLEAGKSPVVIGQPLHAPKEDAHESVEDVEEYMSWLYQERSS